MSSKAASIEEVPDAFMQCRAWRQHLFTKEDDRLVIRSGRVIGIVRWRECSRCGYTNETEYVASGGRWSRVSKPRTSYPDDYLVAGGVTPDEVKDEYVKRLSRSGAQVTPLRRTS